MSMREMAITAMQDQPGVEVATAAEEASPPGETSDPSQATAVATAADQERQWQFPLPSVATINTAKPEPSKQAVAVRDTEETVEKTSSNRVLRRGPRR